MRTHKVFRIQYQDSEQLEELSRLGFTPFLDNESGGWCLLRVATTHPSMPILLDWIEREQTHHHCTIERSFSRREIRSATALHIDIVEPESGSIVGDSMTIDPKQACDKCLRRTGNRASVLNDAQGSRSAAFLRGIEGELIVNRSIAMRMISDGITGAVLEPILSTQLPDNPDPEYYRLVPVDRLPQVTSPPTTFSISQRECNHCGRAGLRLNSMLYFDAPRDVFEDINVTSEVFGDGRLLSPEVVVSPRFYNILVSCGAHDMAPEPVVLV